MTYVQSSTGHFDLELVYPTDKVIKWAYLHVQGVISDIPQPIDFYFEDPAVGESILMDSTVTVIPQ